MDAVKIYEEAARRVGRGEINLMEFWKLIKPLRDVEAVVRCNDCQAYKDGKCIRAYVPAVVDDNNYCSYAARKDGDHHD